MGTSYEGEIEAIKLAVEFGNENITSVHDISTFILTAKQQYYP